MRETTTFPIFIVFINCSMELQLKTSKRKTLNELSLEKKIELIKFVNEGNSMRKAAQQFNLAPATTSRIARRQAEYFRMYEERDVGFNRRRRKRRSTEYTQINELTWAWFQHVRAMDLPVSGPMIQSAAKTFGEQLGKLNFKASTGWLDSFKKAHNIEQPALRGESAEVDLNVVKNVMERLPHLCEDYSSSEIFNAYETGLIFPALPDKNFAGDGYNGRSDTSKASGSGEKNTEDEITAESDVTVKPEDDHAVQELELFESFIEVHEDSSCSNDGGPSSVSAKWCPKTVAKRQKKAQRKRVDNGVPVNSVKVGKARIQRRPTLSKAQAFADALVHHFEQVPDDLWGLCTLQMTQIAVMFAKGVVPETLINPFPMEANDTDIQRETTNVQRNAQPSGGGTREHFD